MSYALPADEVGFLAGAPEGGADRPRADDDAILARRAAPLRRATRAPPRADELKGECDGATHVIASLTVGAFEFFAGGAVDARAGATVLGAGTEGHTGSQRETLNRAGDGASCTPSRGDKEPPPGCGALLRVEVAPLAAAAASPGTLDAAPMPTTASAAAPAPRSAKATPVEGAGPIALQEGDRAVRRRRP